MTRRLTAILFADMEGYTALMQVDEDRAKLFRDRMREVLEMRVREFEGAILQYYGDGALCGFQSAIQAVQCGAAIQADLRRDPTVPVRIGIHMGDVVHDHSGVYGDGVNIAARIQGLSVPGGVLVSDKIADELRNHPSISTRQLATVILKNVREPQTVFGITNSELAVPGFREMREWPLEQGMGGWGRRWKKGLVGAMALVVLVAAGVVVFSPAAEPDAFQPIPLTQESLAILPFHHEGPEANDSYGPVMAIQLSSVLASGVFLPIDQPSIRSLVEGLEEEGLAGSDLLSRVARTSGADLVLYGDIGSGPDGAMTVNAYFFDARTSEVGPPVTDRGTVENFNGLVLSLARRLLLARSEAEPGLLGDLESDSIGALLAWAEGEKEFRAGNYPRAVELLRGAVDGDPGFAIAHYRLSQAALWDWDWDLARSSAEEAWRMSSELSGLNQQLLEAWRSFLNSRPAQAEARYRDLLRDYPRNVEVLAGLVSVLVYFNSLQGRPTEAAAPFIARVLEADPDYGEVRYHALEAAAKEGDLREFDGWFAGLNPESQQRLAFETVRAFRWGSPADREDVVRRLGNAGELQVVYAAGRMAAFLHDFPAAERVGGILLGAGRDPAFRAAAHGLSASLRFAGGRWADADRALALTAEVEPEWSLEMRTFFSLFLATPPFLAVSREELMTLRDSLRAWGPEPFIDFSLAELFGPHSQHHQEFRLYLLGLLSSRLGASEEARAFSSELRAFGHGRETLDLTFALSQSVDAHEEHARGDLRAARSTLEGIGYFPPFEFIFVSPFFSRALDRWLRGELLLELNEPEAALEWFATLSDGWGEFLLAAPAHLRQAQIHESLGNAPVAISHYEAFLALWGDADPVLQPLVAQARAAKEALETADGEGE